MRRVAGRGCRSERGAALVEFSIVVSVAFTLLFAIIDFGSVLSNEISVRQGTREAARSGAVAQFGSTNSCVNPFTTGLVPSTNIQNLMCLAKTRIGLSASTLYIKVVFDSSDGSFSVNNGLIVCALTSATSMTGVTSQLLGARWLETKVEMNIEKASTQTETAGEEAPPAGANWTWCTAAGSTP